MALADFARNFEDGINRRGTVRLRKRGWIPTVIPYAGYGSTHALKVLARVIMTQPEHLNTRVRLDRFGLPGHIKNSAVRDFAEQVIETSAVAQRGWRQFFTTQVGFLPVTVQVGEKRIHTRSDRNGYIDLLVEEHGLTPGWHEVTITSALGESVNAPVMIVSPQATTGLISDIDDTILVTWLPRATLSFWNSFVKHTNSRQTVPGMAELYKHLLHSTPEAPVFYLSTGAWNTYGTLLEFIRRYRFPLGPLLLTDWGPTPNAVFRSGQEHKKTQLRNLLIMFPNIKWILVGDDGQHDPLIYDELAREHPARVRAILLRELGIVEQVLSHGTPERSVGSRHDTDTERDGTPVLRGANGAVLLQQTHRIS